MKIKKDTIILSTFILIVLIGLALRAYSLTLNIYNFNLYGDAKSYFLMAEQWVQEGIYGYDTLKRSGVSNAYVTPGYPVYLYVIMKLFKNAQMQIIIARIGQMLISAAAPVFAYLFVKVFLKRRDIALLTCLFVAVYPTYIEAQNILYTEPLALTTMLIYFYLAAIGIQKKSAIISVLAGISFAIHIMIRPAMLPLVLAPYVYLLTIKVPIKTVFKYFAQTVSGFLIIFIPWWIRNYMALHSIVLLATQSGNPLLKGTYPYMNNYLNDVPQSVLDDVSLQKTFALERIKNGFQSDFWLYLKWYTLGKIGVMFKTPWLYNHMLFQSPWNYVHILWLYPFYPFIHGIYSCLGLLGLIIGSIFNKAIRFLSVYGVLYLVLYLVFIPINRYAYQHMFFLMIAAAYIICTLASKVFDTTWRYVSRTDNSVDF